MKEVYSAINEKSGAEALEDFGKKWDDKYPMIKALGRGIGMSLLSFLINLKKSEKLFTQRMQSSL